jgi:hypothetical protein
MSEPKDSKSEPKSEPSVSVTALAEAFAAALKGQRPPAELLTGLTEEKIAQAQGKNAKPIRERHIPGKSPRTGSTFTMVVVESRSPKHPFGRVVRLENYKLPPAAYIPASQGGELPDGALVWQDPKNQAPLNDSTPSSMLNINFKQTRTTTYWQPDLQQIASGNPLRPECCVDPRAAQFDPNKPGAVPWVDTKMWAERDESAAE